MRMLVDVHGHARALQRVCLLFQARVRARALQRVVYNSFHRENLPSVICHEPRADFNQAELFMKVMGTDCNCKKNEEILRTGAVFLSFLG